MNCKVDKPILRYDEQLKKLSDLGIMVEDTPEEQQRVKNILINNNYFFKLLSYRKNYEKDDDGKYNIEIDSIIDLAKLDMQLRYVLLPYCLDIEHSLKTYLMRLITNKKIDGEFSEDGYEVVQKILDMPSSPENLKDQIFNGVRYYDDKKGEYVYQEGFEKYYNNPPAWVVLDLASVGKLKHFVYFFKNEGTNNDTLKKISNNIAYVSDIRNDCAHNSPIIFKLQKKSKIKHPVYTNAKRMGIKQEEIEILRVAKIFSVFELHRTLCSEDMRKHRNKDFRGYLDRVEKTIKLHGQNKEILTFFKALNKIVDVFEIK